MMVMAAREVSGGSMTVGELVMINAYMIQLFVPLNFLGFIYRESREALTNIERLFGLLEAPAKVVDAPDAPQLNLSAGEVVFSGVAHAYEPGRQILKNVSLQWLGRAGRANRPWQDSCSAFMTLVQVALKSMGRILPR